MKMDRQTQGKEMDFDAGRTTIVLVRTPIGM
jgi:hypothetical protein